MVVAMSEQLDLLDYVAKSALARNSDPDTSHEAADHDMSAMEASVYEVIFSYGKMGCISDQVLSHFPDQQQSVCPRYKKLLNKKLVIDTGERRPGKSGKRQRVMRASIHDT
jgi:hypothetical protein